MLARLSPLNKLSLAAAVYIATSCVGCAVQTSAPNLDGSDEPYVSHEEAVDFEVDPAEGGKADSISPESFDKNTIVTDTFFRDTADLSADDIQKFLENTPYGHSSFLARERVGNARAADAIVEAATDVGINPIVFLARMQVEKSLISKSTRPSTHTVNYAFGCGCPDHRSCMSAYAGLGNQIRCAGKTLDKLYDASVNGTGQCRAGHRYRTLDPTYVIPSNHATAALYAYTPWVLRGRGGNWLVWNVTRKFALHAVHLGLLDPPTKEPWIGTPCENDQQCNFVAGGENGFCMTYEDPQGQPRGFCSIPCEGYCPDKSGHASTFCSRVPGYDDRGTCVSKVSATHNDSCNSIPGTSPTPKDRFVGSSTAPESTAQVCWPDSFTD